LSVNTKEVVSEFGSDSNDVGSSKVQIAILTRRIEILTKHIQTFKKDNSSRRGLLLMIEKRRKLLKYIKRQNNDEYTDILAKLGLRR
jgi:small subunit ribosomal protein S15